MSGKLQGVIYHTPFGSLAAKAIAAKLADWANDDGRGIFASKEMMAKQLECSPRTIGKHINLWLLFGILTIEDLGGGRRGKTKRETKLRNYRVRGKTTTYAFNLDALQRLQDEIETIEDLTAAARERGELDDRGWVRAEVADRLRAGTYISATSGADTTRDVNGAPDAPLNEDGNSAPGASLTNSAPGAPLSALGCTSDHLTVHEIPFNGAPGAPEPYRTQENPSNGRAGAHARDARASRPPDRVKAKGPAAVLRWHIACDLSSAIASAWFGDAKVVIPTARGDPVRVVLPTKFQAQYVAQHYEQHVRNAVREAFDRDVSIVPAAAGDVVFSIQSDQHEGKLTDRNIGEGK